MKLRLLDLFCGAGGAAMGYAKAGFEVTGVDIKPQPHYPFDFVQADALDVAWGIASGKPSYLGPFDAIHASPPCQRFSKSVDKADRPKHPDLIGCTRDWLSATGLPYVIENVPQAPLIDPITLCGSAFGLRVIRHRRFESNVDLGLTPPCDHQWMPRDLPPAWNRQNPLRAYAVSGGWQRLPIEELRAAMGVDWEMTPKELSEAIPPAYTEWIGRQLIAALEHAA